MLVGVRGEVGEEEIEEGSEDGGFVAVADEEEGR